MPGCWARSVSVQPTEISLLGQVPHAAEFYYAALAWHHTATRCVPARHASRCVLRRMLLGDHAADVRRRHRQCWLDACAWWSNGDREECGVGQEAQPASWSCSDCLGRAHRGQSPGANQYETILNLDTGKAPGFDVPPTLLARADEVIE